MVEAFNNKYYGVVSSADLASKCSLPVKLVWATATTEEIGYGNCVLFPLRTGLSQYMIDDLPHVLSLVSVRVKP